ncbi:MAG: hypoxanthine phosphoribosyltransferase, partial [Prevotella sp.]|nr:hypoxanthine phosphoribosyltransferase [Prevotella sp.]
MDTIQVLDKKFRISIPESEILKRIDAVAERINKDMAGKNPLFMAVLNGSFIFAADLLRRITIPCEVSFVKLASYQGTLSSGKVTEVIGINENLAGRTIIIVEDIVESGLTMRQMLDSLSTRNPESVHICTLLLKPERLKVDLNLEYVAISIPNDFILGYGLDYNQQGRGLKDIYTLVPEEEENIKPNHNNRAQWEIRELAWRMLVECRKVAPVLFEKAGPDCVAKGTCKEGKMSCGILPKVKQYQAEVKNVAEL